MDVVHVGSLEFVLMDKLVVEKRRDNKWKLSANEVQVVFCS